MKLNFQDGTSTADLVIGADAMYKGKMFEGLPEGYHALEANVKINGEDVSPKEVKDHILEHYRLVQQRMNAFATTRIRILLRSICLRIAGARCIHASNDATLNACLNPGMSHAAVTALRSFGLSHNCFTLRMELFSNSLTFHCIES